MQNYLSECKLDGRLLYLPAYQIPPAEYSKVKRAINGIGGVWNTRSQAFVFNTDPRSLFDRIIKGEKINLDAEFKKKTQYFATTPEVFSEMAEYISISNDMRVLEPHGGEGFICDSLLDMFPRSQFDWRLDVCELYDPFQEALRLKGYNVIGSDFLELERPARGYSLIVANPPFSNGQDIRHFQKMYSVLAPGGRIVTCMSNAWRTSKDKDSVSLREWLNYYFHSLIDLPAGAFKKSGTSIAACMLVFDKPLEEEY